MKETLIGNTAEEEVLTTLDLLAVKGTEVEVVSPKPTAIPAKKEQPKEVLSAKEQRRADRQAQRNQKKGN